MKPGLLPGALTLGCIFFIIASSEALAAPTDILLSEVSIAGIEASDEFIELYNQGDTSLDLSGLQLRRRTSSGSESSIKVFAKNSIILAHGYFLWANSQGIFKIPFADSETSSSALAPDNSIGLFTKSGVDGVLIDSIAWGKGAPFSPATPAFPNPEKQTSLTRALATLSWSQGIVTPTNSKGVIWVTPVPEPIPEPLPLPGANTVRFNEVFPNSAAKGDQGEFIELYNLGNTSQDISGWIIRDATKTGKYTFPTGTLFLADTYLVITDQTFTLSLNNTNETLSLFDATGAVIDTMNYEKTKEDVSLNFTTSGWRGGRPTPGKINELNNLPETREKVPKKGYRGVPVDFDARGRDSDGEKLKYTWNFGDNHRSYKEKTSHTYEENGMYSVTLATTDGSDDVTETFTLKIETLPKPDIRITALVPNPAGKDTEGEWIIIENRGKKSVDLKGFGIATGWKKLVNHPIRESFVITPKSQRKLTRGFSLFTLPNQKGKIELRASDGAVLQKIKYKLEKSAQEDVIYFKKKGKRWQWDESQSPLSKTKTATPIEEPIIDAFTEEIDTVPKGEDSPETEALPEVLGAEAPRIEPARLQLTALLNYGTRVILPENIALTADALPREASLAEKEHYAITFTKKMFKELNASFNTWQNEEEVSY